ncbi:peroxiredoxin family protein [Fundidesulfovibrio magnetotacticus]|nr:TlpA disulfide reductase family protein [Fundidesulfovibrio magnetotacticus]
MKPLAEGQAFPDLAFKGPISDAEAKELGVAPGKPFAFKDIKAQAVILVVFSMYCPFCQRDAPELAKMHQIIKDRGLSGKVKLVGLGAGNSAFEVNVFREKFALRLPLIPDQDFSVYKALGQVGTPYYYVLARSGPGFTVVEGHLGCVSSAEAFLNQALAKAGIGGK